MYRFDDPGSLVSSQIIFNKGGRTVWYTNAKWNIDRKQNIIHIIPAEKRVYSSQLSKEKATFNIVIDIGSVVIIVTTNHQVCGTVNISLCII